MWILLITLKFYARYLKDLVLLLYCIFRSLHRLDIKMIYSLTSVSALLTYLKRCVKILSSPEAHSAGCIRNPTREQAGDVHTLN